MTTFSKSFILYYDIGVSPSGKATDSDSVTRRFESCYPSQARGYAFSRNRKSVPLVRSFLLLPYACRA